MQVYSIELDKLPQNIQDAILSEEYFEFSFFLHEKYDLTDDQDKGLISLIAELFEKEVLPQNFVSEAQTRIGISADIAKKIEKEVFTNIILLFPEYFGDQQVYFKSIGGTQEDINTSKVLQYVIRTLTEQAQKKITGSEKVDYQKQAAEVKKLFREELIDYLYPPDDEYKIALNGLIFDLLAQKENYIVDLVTAILENVQTIGEEKIQRDGVGYPPIVSEWLRDLHAFSSPDDVTTLSIAKYITQNQNVKKLSDRDHEVLRRLFHTYYTLKNFPDSLAKVPQEQWMIIPYRVEDIPGGVFTPDYSALEGMEEKESQTPLANTSEKTVAVMTTPQINVSFPRRRESSKLDDSVLKLDPRLRGDDNSKVETITPPPATSASLLAQSVVPPPSVSSPAPALLDIPEQHVVEPLPSMPRAQAREPASSDITSLTTGIPAFAGMTINQVPSMDYNAQAQEIIKKSGISLSDETLHGRLQTILVTRLRNVRNDTQTKLRLMDPASEGGVGLSEAQTENILKLLAPGVQVLEQKSEEKTVSGPISQEDSKKEADTKNKIKNTEENKNQKSGQLNAGSFVSAQDDKQTLSHNSASDIREQKPTITPLPTSLAIQDVDGVPTIVEKGAEDEQLEKKQELKQPEKLLKVAPTDTAKTIGIPVPTLTSPAMQGKDVKKIPIKMGPASVGGKVSMSDVRTPPRLMDIVEELRFMTLKDFRRLSPKPEEATQKILKKIQLLEKESYTRKMAGIQAWKENEIAKLYLQIGQESFGKGQSIGAVVDQRKAANQEYLTSEEFDALLDFNEELR
ncbi:hypothetical protein HY621_01240 [Candidatus Uhrbacteria bacterium]|nr:hypothetical protein [Candidatus Uhrbacteria bacterium]